MYWSEEENIRQLSPWAATVEPVLEARNHDLWAHALHPKKPLLRRGREPGREEALLSAERENPRSCKGPAPQNTQTNKIRYLHINLKPRAVTQDPLWPKCITLLWPLWPCLLSVVWLKYQLPYVLFFTLVRVGIGHWTHFKFYFPSDECICLTDIKYLFFLFFISCCISDFHLESLLSKLHPLGQCRPTEI